jgi:hypothetical protein
LAPNLFLPACQSLFLTDERLNDVDFNARTASGRKQAAHRVVEAGRQHANSLYNSRFLEQEEAHMFQRSTVQIRQKSQAGPNAQDKWTKVTLMRAKVGDLPFRDAVFPTSSQPGDDDPLTPFKAMESMAQGYGWWGRWKPGANSVNLQVDNEYTVGTAHRDSRYWVYNFKTYELHLVQRSMESGWAQKGGGPPTGYKVTYVPALELYGVRIDGRGVKPLHGDEGTGWVRIGNRMLRQERVYWEKTVTFD